MKMKSVLFSLILLLPLALLAQEGPPSDGSGPPPPPPGAGMPPGGMHGHGMGGGRGEMGKWWQNSDVAQKLQLNNQQITQLDQIFTEHKLKLIDDEAEMQKQDLKLQTLLDQDSPSESQVGTQVDQVLAARGQLEREFTMMHLALRKVLTVEQWKELKSMHSERGPGHHMNKGGPPPAGSGSAPPSPGF
jgi:Spy/CpxP family protein refolding chaperone